MEPYMKEYEEYKTLPAFWGWVVLVLICVALMGYGMLSHMVIAERPREWDHGGVPLVPGEAKSTTALPPAGPVPQQIHPLPTAYPLEKLAPDTLESFSEECVR